MKRLFPMVVVAWFVTWLGIFAAFVGLVWVAVHFIRKYW